MVVELLLAVYVHAHHISLLLATFTLKMSLLPTVEADCFRFLRFFLDAHDQQVVQVSGWIFVSSVRPSRDACCCLVHSIAPRYALNVNDQSGHWLRVPTSGGDVRAVARIRCTPPLSCVFSPFSAISCCSNRCEIRTQLLYLLWRHVYRLLGTVQLVQRCCPSRVSLPVSLHQFFHSLDHPASSTMCACAGRCMHFQRLVF